MICSLTYKLPQNVQSIRRNHKLYGENHENLESGMESRREKLNCSENPERLFQGDALSPLLFVIAMMPLNYIFRRCTGYKFDKLQEKINHLMHMDDIKLFCQK